MSSVRSLPPQGSTSWYGHYSDLDAFTRSADWAIPGTTFSQLWVTGSGWPPRITTRTDIFVRWLDPSNLSAGAVPTDKVLGDTITVG
jgi:hypothetical protein